MLHVFTTLMHRELRRIMRLIWSLSIDSASVIATQFIFFVRLFPLLGVSTSYAAPIYLGATLSFIFYTGWGYCLNLVADLKSPRFIDYQTTLPISLHGILATYITAFSLQIGIVIVPVALVGFYLIDHRPPLDLLSLLTAGGILFLGTIMISIFFVALAFLCEPEWLKANAFSRILAPLSLINASFLVWQDVYTLSPALGYLLACNPMTYVSEGVRSALLDATRYLPVHLCAAVLLGTTALLYPLMLYGARRRLDAV